MSDKSTFYTRYRRKFQPIESIPANLKEIESYKDRERELYESLYIRHGKAFADYSFRDIERQEDLRVGDFGKDKNITNKQMELF